VNVDADQILQGNFYGAGNTVSISGKAEQDVYVAGGTVTINAEVGSDLVVAGGTVQVHAPVGDDLRVVGGDVTVAGKVGGDLVVAGGTVNVLSTAEIDGDILFVGGDVVVSGAVKGSVVGTANTVRIDSGVGGDVKVTADQLLTLTDRAEVMGNVIYKSSAGIARAQNATVTGNVTHQSISSSAGNNTYAILPLFAVLFAALTIFLLFRERLQLVVDTTKTSFGTNGLIGLGVFLTVPVVSVLLMVSVLGIIPGVVLLLAYIALMLIVWVCAGIVLGTLVLKSFMKIERVSLLSIIVGIILFDLVTFIPYIGFLLVLAIFLIVLGGISRLLYASFR
jgi:hypothetical protein